MNLMEDFVFAFDFVIELLQHEFFMMLGGLGFFYIVKMNWETKPKNVLKKEFRVAATASLVFLIWDDESLNFLSWMLKTTGLRAEDAKPIKMMNFFYIFIGIIIDRLKYVFVKLGDRWTKKS